MSGPFFVARRLFFRRRREQAKGHPLFGAAAGIALSLVPLITVDHVAAAMIEGIIARYRETSSYHIQVHNWGFPEQSKWEEAAENLTSKESVSDAWVERQGFGLARGAQTREGLTLRALPSDVYLRDAGFSSYIEFDEGKWDLSSGDSILLGREAARRLGASIDDEIRVLTARRLNNGRYIPKVTRFTVKGVFSSGYQDLDRTWAFIPLETGWSILSDESSTTFIGCKVPHPQKIGRSFADSIIATLGEGWVAYVWTDLNRYLLSNLNTTRGLLIVIMALIIIVAVVNVLTSLIMLTLERRREIGILKCTGTSPRAITRTFFLAGIFAAAVGTVFGSAGGLLIARFVNEIISAVEFLLGLFTAGPGPKLLDEGYYLQYIPITIRWGATAVIALSTFVLSLLAAALPAFRASRLKPLDVLRKH